jgi:trimethylamine:corrinoid methyltransferase-like protein
LDAINFLPFLFPDDAPVKTADVHALATVLKATAKHVWVQPYNADSVAHLIALGGAAAGGVNQLEANPVISMIACSLTPRAFKHMDIEIMLQAARAGLPIHACSLPGAGGTAPATMAGTVLLAVAEILAMVAMIQAVRPGSPVVACPIIFSTDMRTGRSLQSSVEAMRGASLAVQVIRGEFNLPTHNYGSGSDSPVVDEQAAAERAMLTTLMALSGSDILGGAGQLEVATAVSPLQLIVDNEILSMARGLIAPFQLNEEEFGWEALVGTPPGQHFMTSEHTFRHCREGFMPMNFSRLTRDGWEQAGSGGLMGRVRQAYLELRKEQNAQCAPPEVATEIDSLVKAADRSLL